MTWFQDLRYALRQLRKSPGFTVAALVTLGLAICANAVVFSILNAFILRPLNVPHSETLYGLWRVGPNDMAESYPDYVELRDRNHSFDSLLAYNITAVGLDTGNTTQRSWINETTGNYFDELGIQPYLGKFFHASDEHGFNSAPYIVLNYSFWHTHFHDDAGVIGREVRLNKHPFTIIGVAPSDFHGTLLFFHPDFFVPIVNDGQLDGNDFNDRANHWMFMTMGHLKAGVTTSQAISDLNAITADLQKAYPASEPKVTFELARPSLYGEYVGRPVREFLTGLMLMSSLILLAACANLGSLFAARAADRSREIALRLALGSSRKRILRSLFSEAVLISLVGGAVGLWASIFILRGLSTWEPFPRWPAHLSVNPDARVYVVALLLALASGFLFGMVPVCQVLRTTPYEVVKAGSLAKVGRRITTREILMGTQIAICALLVTSSMVAVRGFHRSLHANFGFNPEKTMLLDTDLAMAGYHGDRVPVMQKRMTDALRGIPGVESVGFSDQVPLGDSAPDSAVFSDSTTDLRPGNARLTSVEFRVSPDFFLASGTTLLSGRVFTEHDGKDSPRVAVVSRRFATEIFGSITSAMGGHYKMPDGTRLQVVGVVEDGKYGTHTESPPLPAMFLPILQWPTSSTWLIVRSEHDPEQLAGEMRNVLRQLDPGLPMFMQSRPKEMEIALFGPRMATLALSVLGVMGAMLALTGIFGMAAYSVSKRLRELGIRVALGGQRKHVLQAALGRAFKLLVVGSATGLILGILASPVLAFIVDQATPRDPLVLTGVVLAMALLGLLATWIPARRALSVEPMILLREE